MTYTYRNYVDRQSKISNVSLNRIVEDFEDENMLKKEDLNESL